MFSGISMPRESEIYFIRLSSVIAFVTGSLRLAASSPKTLLKLSCPSKSPSTFAASSDSRSPLSRLARNKLYCFKNDAKLCPTNVGFT